jgi:hypothetical protein
MHEIWTNQHRSVFINDEACFNSPRLELRTLFRENKAFRAFFDDCKLCGFLFFYKGKTKDFWYRNYKFDL